MIDSLQRCATLVLAPDADHSFHVLRSAGRTDAAVLEKMLDAAAKWIEASVLATD